MYKMLCKKDKKTSIYKLVNALDNQVSPVDKSNILANGEVISIVFLNPHFAAVPHWLHPNLSVLSKNHFLMVFL